MKTLKYYFLLTTSLLILSSCDTNDDGFYNVVYLNATDLVTVETEPSYNVGDFIFVTADFSRYQQEVGQDELLDIYKTTGNATRFIFPYYLERKKADGTWEVVPIPTNTLQIIKGSAISGPYVSGSCVFNSADDTYEYNVGVPLTQAGDYRLGFGYDTSSNRVELVSNSTGLNLYMDIMSTTNYNSPPYYLFTVN
ncbi:hypothetical protein [Flavobacterium sp. GT3R68]|uniref:hypothetical protein n=1 Tax=Flavobacterium sp. GT3R68 TaxID=2594437 RepID=UPI000F8692CC|nr:hypothetical protein [Flavobacterium sp. GT3R68]RTY93630.1 hypothetical protein EKL32_14990 [Flavobacterium sp. GSN2]TRW91649.1 hypothetical protein FNW07_07095 [Flavobacterium sp. GT3R68]